MKTPLTPITLCRVSDKLAHQCAQALRFHYFHLGTKARKPPVKLRRFLHGGSQFKSIFVQFRDGLIRTELSFRKRVRRAAVEYRNEANLPAGRPTESAFLDIFVQIETARRCGGFV